MSYQEEKIENWVSDFCQSDELNKYNSVVKEYAPQILKSFLLEASKKRNVDPGEIVTEDLPSAVQSSCIGLPESVASVATSMIAEFLERLTVQGRVADGETLALYVKGMSIKTKQEPIKRPGSKLNRNDPCPCGSGQKYKKCCMNLLG